VTQATVTSAREQRLAGWSLILGVTGLLTAIAGIGVLLALAAIVLGGLALALLHPWRPHDGHVAALCGVIFGIAALLAFPVLLATAVPRLVALHREHQAVSCWENLHFIALTKDEWARAHQATNGTAIATNDFAAVFPNGLPRCPGGGRYRVNPVGTPPECSIVAHTLAPK